jgi:hypothetical protein
MVNCVEERPDQTALELLVEFQGATPDDITSVSCTRCSGEYERGEVKLYDG